VRHGLKQFPYTSGAWLSDLRTVRTADSEFNTFANFYKEAVDPPAVWEREERQKGGKGAFCFPTNRSFTL